MYIKPFEIKLITGFLKLLVAMRMENVDSEINAPSTLFHIMHWSVRILMFVSVFEVKIIFNVILFLILTLFFFFWLHGLWDLSSGTRDPTSTTCIGRQSCNHWTASEVPEHMILWFFSEGDHSLIKILKEEGENLGFTEAGKVNKSHKEGLTVSLSGLEKRVEAFFFVFGIWVSRVVLLFCHSLEHKGIED